MARPHAERSRDVGLRMLATVAVAVAYAIGSVPVAYVVGRVAGGIDLREYGSGSTGASNVWQSVSKWLTIPVGLAQIAQGLAGVLIARATDHGDGVLVVAGLAAVVAHNWNPWLGFTGGRGVGVAIGVLLGISPAALGVFIVVSLAGVALKANPQAVGLGMVLAPLAALAAGQSATVVVGCALLTTILAAKRLTANGVPEAQYARPSVWWTRLVYDRDTRDRDAWVRRGLRRDERQHGA